MSLPRFVVPPAALDGPSCVLTGPILRHLRARRLGVGSHVVLTDGLGGARHGVVAHMDRHHALVRITGSAEERHESPLQLTLALGLLKADKLDFVVEKATELGVHDMLFFTSSRTVGRVSSGRRERWQRIARSAAEQSQRTVVPAIAGPIDLHEILARPGAALRLLFWEAVRAGGLGPLHATQPSATRALVLVGPEGGFSADEAALASRAGFHLVGLSGRILRAETAALVAVTLVQFLWGDLTGPHER